MVVRRGSTVHANFLANLWLIICIKLPLQGPQTQMAQSLFQLPGDVTLFECRAIIFARSSNYWIVLGEPKVKSLYSVIEVIYSHPPGGTRHYKVLARLESSGVVRNLLKDLSFH